MTIEEAKLILKKEEDDSESYHMKFDNIIENRLMELDPKFMEALKEEYERSGNDRWYA